MLKGLKNFIKSEPKAVDREKKSLSSIGGKVVYIMLLLISVLIIVTSVMSIQISEVCDKDDSDGNKRALYLSMGVGVGMILYAILKFLVNPMVVVLIGVTWILISIIYINSIKSAGCKSINDKVSYGVLGVGVGIVFFMFCSIFFERLSVMMTAKLIVCIGCVLSGILCSLGINEYNSKCDKVDENKKNELKIKRGVIIGVLVMDIAVFILMMIWFYKKQQKQN